MKPHQKPIFLLAMLFFAAVVLAVTPMAGMQVIPLWDIFHPGFSSVESEIFWSIRVPRVCTSFLAGAGLALSGMVFQAMFRNLLATPFTLGVASGASLGAAIYVRLGCMFSVFCIPGVSVCALAGAVLSIGLVYGLTRMKKNISTTTMLLAGVAVSFFFSSLIIFIQYMSDFTHSFRIVRWLMGGIEAVGFESVLNVAPFVIGGSAIILFLTNELNLLMAGEELSASRGVDVDRTRKLLFFAASLMVGGVVAVCGPIGFVGMMAPHICRLMIGADHRYLTPATILFGGVFLTLCDMFARVVIAPAEMPVGVITALLGGPFFVWLLLSRSSGRWGMW